jgi:DNA topoisomerase IA
MNKIDLNKLAQDIRKALGQQPVSDINVVVVPDDAIYASAVDSTVGHLVKLSIQVKMAGRY